MIVRWPQLPKALSLFERSVFSLTKKKPKKVVNVTLPRLLFAAPRGKLACLLIREWWHPLQLEHILSERWTASLSDYSKLFSKGKRERGIYVVKWICQLSNIVGRRFSLWKKGQRSMKYWYNPLFVLWLGPPQHRICKSPKISHKNHDFWRDNSNIL